MSRRVTSSPSDQPLVGLTPISWATIFASSMQAKHRVLESQADLAAIGEASNGSEALALAIELASDVVMMDIEMPKGNALEAIRRILKFAA